MKHTLQRVRGQAARGQGSRRRPAHRRIFLGLQLIVVVGVFATSAAVALCVVTLHLGIRPVLTGSMHPDYGPGAILLTRRVPASSLKPGMIVLFVPPGEQAQYAHRITSVSRGSDGPVITTKGDANTAADPWHAVITTSDANQVIGSVPEAGRVFVAIHGTGQILLALAGGATAAWAGTRWVFSWPRTRRAHATPRGA